MATISDTNNVLPIGGLNFNPAIEEILDTTPAVVDFASGLYEIANNNGGPFNGFKVQFTSNVNGTGNFTFTNVGAVLKPAGTITGMSLRAPDGTVIAQVTPGAGGFGDVKLQDFYSALTNPAAKTPADAIFAALDSLFYNSNTVIGSAVADHLTSYGNSSGDMMGDGGNDVLWSRGYATSKLVGGAGDDLIRLEDGLYEAHGGNADGSGAAGQTDTIEVVGYVGRTTNADFAKFTNIDVLRFVTANQPASGSVETAEMSARFDLKSVGAANLPATLTVQGSAASYTHNEIGIYGGSDAAATTGLTLNLSGWTFTNWDEARNEVYVSTNSTAKALNDNVTGSSVAETIYTYYGDDTIRGGGGADELNGGAGNDTFVYGLNEAADGEWVSGGYGPEDGTADTVLILADNDFTGVQFTGIDQFVFGGAAKAVFSQSLIDAMGSGAETKVLTAPPTIVGDAGANTIAFQLEKSGGGVPSIDVSDVVFNAWSNGKDTVTITGLDSADTISGSVKDDVINGAAGGDALQGNGGADAFVFDAGFGKGVDHIADFRRKEGDRLHLDDVMFTRLKVGELKKSAFEIGERADSKKDRIIYDKEDGIVRYDDDGTGRHKAKIVAVLDDAASLKAGDFLVI